MKSLLISAMIFLGVSCSSLAPVKQLPPYNPQVNCSPKGLEFLKKNGQFSQSSMTEKIKRAQRFKRLISPHLDAASACYQESLKSIPKQSYNVCVVVDLTAENEIFFLDIDDNTNHLPDNLYKCLDNIFYNVNYKSFGPGAYTHSLKFQAK